MSKKRRRLEIKVEPLPAPFQDETASCPVCGRDAAAIGRRHLQIVFRCEGCKVVFKRNRSWPYVYSGDRRRNDSAPLVPWTCENPFGGARRGGRPGDGG